MPGVLKLWIDVRKPFKKSSYLSKELAWEGQRGKKLGRTVEASERAREEKQEGVW